MTRQIWSAFADMFSIPQFEYGPLRVWKRNYHLFLRNFWSSVFFLGLEPALYIFAIGYGLGQFVGFVEGLPYVRYFLPGLLVISSGLVAFFESSFGVFSRQNSKGGHRLMKLAPLGSDEISLGEMLWASTKGTLSAIWVTTLAVVLGHLNYTFFLPVVCISFVSSWIFAAVGLLVVSLVQSRRGIILFQTAIVLPLILFSNTFFPVREISASLSAVFSFFPVLYLVDLIRSFFSEQQPASIVGPAAIILSYATFITTWSVARIRRKFSL